MKEKLYSAAKCYKQIPMPHRYEELVANTIKEGEKRRGEKKMTGFKKSSIAAAILFGAFVTTLNVNAQFAEVVTSMPLIGEVAKVFQFKQYEEKTDSYELDVKVPQIDVEGSTDYTQAVNDAIQVRVEEIIQMSKETAKVNKEAYIVTGGKAEDYIPMQINVDYTVHYDKDGIVSFVIDHIEAGATVYQKQYFYTLDLINKQVVTLEDLFGEGSQEAINASIQKQMDERKEQDDATYFSDFKGIREDQPFYINAYGKPVIVFEKYEVASGVMGIQQFEINDVPLEKDYKPQVSYEIINKKEENTINYPQIVGYKGELLGDYMNQSLYSIVEKYQKPSYSNLVLDYVINRIDDEVLSVTYRGSVHLEGIGIVLIYDSINLDVAKTGAEITVANYIKDDPDSRAKWQELMNQKAIEKGLHGFEAEGVRMCFKDSRIVFYYMPLDDSAREPVYITIPLEEMEGIVTLAFEEVYHS
ncbi:MAG: DUF3298 domain-containing protein [Cellulosilyticaceae bacterium]